MDLHFSTCPLTQRQLVDGYFLEHRNQILEVAAFLDRLDRAASRDAENDFRVEAFRWALAELRSSEPGRVERIQMILSDPVVTLLRERDRQGAYGASGREVRKTAR